MTLYAIYGKDGLPLFIEENVKDLAIKSGLSYSGLKSIFCRVKAKKYKSERFIVIDVKD